MNKFIIFEDKSEIFYQYQWEEDGEKKLLNLITYFA